MFPGSFRAKLNILAASVFRNCGGRAAPLLPRALYPLLAYAYFSGSIYQLKSEEWTFPSCVSLGAGHASSLLATQWGTVGCASRTSRSVGSIQDADCIRIARVEHGGRGKIVCLCKKDVGDVLLLLS